MTKERRHWLQKWIPTIVGLFVIAGYLTTMGLFVWPWNVQKKQESKTQHEQIRGEINEKIKRQDAVLDKLDRRTWQILEAVKQD